MSDAPKEIIHPLVHLNGSSAQHLIDEALGVAQAIGSAMARLAEAAPNARDYYPLGDAAWNQAKREHEDRQARLKSVYDEIAAIYTKLENDRDAAKRR